MVILSLFDGIACGRLALERAGLPVDAYYASEIDKDAIGIALYNHLDVTEIGSVTDISYDRETGCLHTARNTVEVGKVDLVMAGSPCTDFSTVGLSRGMVCGETEIVSLPQYLDLKNRGFSFTGQSYLFWEFVRLLEEVKPKWFLLENIVMPNKWRKIVDDALGTEPIKISSALVSAHGRTRLYWTNIPNVGEPDDRNILLENILDRNASNEDVSGCQTVQLSFADMEKKYGYIPKTFNPFNRKELTTKACNLSRGSMVTSSCATLLFVKTEDGVHEAKDGILDGKYHTPLKDGRYNLRKLSLTEMERLQTLPDGYTDIAGISKQKRGGCIGNGWTVDIIAHILSNIPKENI